MPNQPHMLAPCECAASTPTEASILDWPTEFMRSYGRKPRILHLGNVANYAYVNAKIQRMHGIDSYVMDPDFYHIMASPEWVEVEIEGDHGDDFLPDWSSVELHGYRPPHWFVQGPFKLCVDYLLAHLSGHSIFARQLRVAIDFHRRRNLGGLILKEDGPPTLRQRVWSTMGSVYGRLRRLAPKQGGGHSSRPSLMPCHPR